MLAEERLVVISNEQARAEGRMLGLTEEDKQAFGDRLVDESGEIIDLDDESIDEAGPHSRGSPLGVNQLTAPPRLDGIH